MTKLFGSKSRSKLINLLFQLSVVFCLLLANYAPVAARFGIPTQIPTQAAIASGETGNCKWSISLTGILGIQSSTSGTYTKCTLGSYTSASSVPWHAYASQIKTVYLVSPGVNAGTNAAYLFADLTNVTNWSTLNKLYFPSTTNISYMFSNSSFSNFSLISSWSVSAITNMNYLFNSCASLKSIDLTSWTFNSSVSTTNMFSNVSASFNSNYYKSAMGGKKLYVVGKYAYTNFTTTNLTSNPSNLVFMPYWVAKSASGGAVSVYSTLSTTLLSTADASNYFAYTGAGTYNSSYDYFEKGGNAVYTLTPNSGYSLTSFTDNGTSKLSSVSGSRYTISSISANHTLSAVFTDTSLFGTNCKWTVISNILTIQPTSTSVICTLPAYSSGSAQPWNSYKSSITSVVINANVYANANSSYLLYGLPYAASMNVANLNVSNLTNASYMISGASNLHSLDISSWNLAKMTTSTNMFSGMTSAINTNYYNSAMSGTKLYIIGKRGYSEFSSTNLTANPDNLVFNPYSVQASASSGGTIAAASSSTLKLSAADASNYYAYTGAGTYNSAADYYEKGGSAVYSITSDTNMMLSSLTDNSSNVFASVSENTYTISSIQDNHILAADFSNSVVNINITAEKRWEDELNQDGIRPDGIFLQMLQNGTEYGDPVLLSETNSWQYTWAELPETINATPVVYSVRELATTPVP